jgi:hypothetical protein
MLDKNGRNMGSYWSPSKNMKAPDYTINQCDKFPVIYGQHIAGTFLHTSTKNLSRGSYVVYGDIFFKGKTRYKWFTFKSFFKVDQNLTLVYSGEYRKNLMED